MHSFRVGSGPANLRLVNEPFYWANLGVACCSWMRFAGGPAGRSWAIEPYPCTAGSGRLQRCLRRLSSSTAAQCSSPAGSMPCPGCERRSLRCGRCTRPASGRIGFRRHCYRDACARLVAGIAPACCDPARRRREHVLAVLAHDPSRLVGCGRRVDQRRLRLADRWPGNAAP